MYGRRLTKIGVRTARLASHDVVCRRARGRSADQVAGVEASALKLRAVEVRMVEQVEEVHAELNAVVFSETPVLRKLQIDISIVRTVTVSPVFRTDCS